MFPIGVSWLNFTGFVEVDTIVGDELGYFDVRINFFPNWFDSIRMDWEVPGEMLSLDPKFRVLVSENEEGPFRECSPQWSSDPFFTVTNTFDSSKFGREFYVLQVLLSDGRVLKSAPQVIGNRLPRWQFLRWKEITRREWIMLDKFYGVDCVVFRRKEYGTRCSYCWDAKNEKVTRDHCEHCFGTSYEGGFYKGISTLMQFNQWAGTKSNTYFGKYEPNQVMAWTMNYPTIKPHDIIIRLTDYTVYRVEMTQNTTIMTVPQRQIFKLTQLSKTSIENRLLQRGGWSELRERPQHIHK